jgi:hypothetical protein
MANLAATAAAIENYCGFPAARTRTVARRLLEDRMLTPGAPGVAVEISEADFALLLIGVASVAPLSRVADVTAELADAVPCGVDVGIMPEAIRPSRTTAFDVLSDTIWNAAYGDGRLSFDVEITSNFPEVAFHNGNGTVRFVPAGIDSTRWQSAKQRSSTRVPHAAIAAAARALFGAN